MTLLGWLTFLLGSQAMILPVLLFWIYLFLVLVFVLQWLSDHVVVSVSIHFPLNSQLVASFHHIAYDYSFADWDGFLDHLTDGPWEDIFKLSASTAASEFFEWIQVGIDVYIPHHKYQVKSPTSPLFSVACALSPPC